jgi:hypothetical protein
VARGANLKRLRAKYAGKQPFPKPAAIDGHRWAIFTAYCHGGLTSREIGESAGISPSRVCQVLYEVDARLESARRAGAGGKPIVLDSPIEDLALSSRARNALRSLGCDSVQDVLRLDLSGSRGIGRKTRGEVLAVLRTSGLPHAKLEEPSPSEIRSLDRSLERMHGRISAALGAVAREIALVQKRLRRGTDAQDGGPGGGVTSA